MRDPLVSVVLCTHNPSATVLNKVLSTLSGQSLRHSDWEFIVVDSASTVPILERIDLKFPERTSHVRASRPGLAYARLLGFKASRAPIIASLDDDTMLCHKYLEEAVAFLTQWPDVGIISGRVLPLFEAEPPPWISEVAHLLAVRDLGDDAIIREGCKEAESLDKYPDCGPLGVNVSRRAAIEAYLHRWERDSNHHQFGRRGHLLDSGEDNDFALCAIESGWGVAYVPKLELIHLIPRRRLDTKYLAELNRASSRTWVKVLALHNICPWSPISTWTVPFRKLKAWFAHRAWVGPVERIRWRGACGQFEGLSQLYTKLDK